MPLTSSWTPSVAAIGGEAVAGADRLQRQAAVAGAADRGDHILDAWSRGSARAGWLHAPSGPSCAMPSQEHLAFAAVRAARSRQRASPSTTANSSRCSLSSPALVWRSQTRSPRARSRAAAPRSGVCTSPAPSSGTYLSPAGHATCGIRSGPGGPDAIQPPPSRVAMSGRGLRTTDSANDAAGAGANAGVGVEQVRAEQPAAGGHLGDRGVGRRELERAGAARRSRTRGRRSRAPRRPPLRAARASSRPERSCIQSITRARTGRPEGRLPTPAICDSYAINPTNEKPGRAAIRRARSTASRSVLTGDRHTPSRPSAREWNAASSSIATRTVSRRFAGSTASMASSCSTESIISVMRAAADGSVASDADRRPVHGRVPHHDVVDRLGEPQRLRQGVGEHPVVAGQRQHRIEHRAHAHRLRRDPDRHARDPVEQVEGVVREGRQRDHAERRVQVCGRRIQALPEPGGLPGPTVGSVEFHVPRQGFEP